MFLEKIKLLDFKSYTEQEMVFGPGANSFVGRNGSGKTNLLDAIHFLSLSKSSINAADSLAVRQGAAFFMIKGFFERKGVKEEVLVSFQKNKKTIKRNQEEVPKISAHIGEFPCVLIAPDDTDLVREGSETRRRFFDGVICQADKTYLEDLMLYNKILKNRNALLKQIADGMPADALLLETYSQPLLFLSKKIYEKRAEFTGRLLPVFGTLYQRLSEGYESVSVAYISQLEKSGFEARFEAAYPRDLALQRTTCGIHKDDFEFLIEGAPLKNFGSQGQQKSFVIALKLAQHALLSQKKGFPPLLLLDDIFDKLDDRRIARLVEIIAGEGFGQMFLTDARPERTRKFLEPFVGDLRIIDIEALAGGF